MTGFVLGIAQIVVNPPQAAACEPVPISSLYVCPGSRRWTWRSTNPGITQHPDASIVTAISVEASSTVPPETEASLTIFFFFGAGNVSPSPICVTHPSSIRTSVTLSVPESGSSSRPPRINICIFDAPFHSFPHMSALSPSSAPASAGWNPRPTSRQTGRTADPDCNTYGSRPGSVLPVSYSPGRTAPSS